MCGIIIHPHLSRPSRVLHSTMPAEPGEGASLRLPLDEVGQDHVEAVIHLKGESVVHRGVNHAPIQLGGHLAGPASQLSGHVPNLVPIKVDGSHPLGIATVAHLVALAVETVSSCLIGKFI